MISMTGFGYTEKEMDGLHLSVEIKTINSRYLDLSVNLPSSLSMLENQIQKRLQQIFRRGRIDLIVRMRGVHDPRCGIDMAVAESWKVALDQLASVLDDPEPVTMDLLVKMEGVFKYDPQKLPQNYWTVIENVLELASQQVNEDRQREGQQLACDIDTQIRLIDKQLKEIEILAPQIKADVEQNLRKRFKQVAGDNLEESRVLTEIAAWIAKTDINEEIVRLASHIDSFKEVSSSDLPVGKKLDFICQEMGREINTLGVKTPNINVSRHTVEMKDALEKIREQLRNVE